MRVAVLLLALPVVSAIVVSRTRYRVASERRVEPLRVPAGQPARVKLRLENVSRLPTGLAAARGRRPVHPGLAPAFRRRPGRAARSSRDRLHGAVRRSRRLHDRPADSQAVRPVRPLRDVEVVLEPGSLRRHAARPPTSRGPARWRVVRQRRQPLAVDRRRRRGRHRHPRVPPRRRPAPSALALHRPARRAHGASRGAAVAEPRHRAPGHPQDRPPRRRSGVVVRVGRVGSRFGRGPSVPARVRRSAGDRHRRRGRRWRRRSPHGR